MAKLVCAVVGEGVVFSVDIELNNTVYDLKKKIKKDAPVAINLDPCQLKLYLAREGDSWLDSRDEDIKALRAKKLPDRIKNLMQKHLQLPAPRRLNNDACFGNNFVGGSDNIHVLVECPHDQVLKYLEYKRNAQDGFLDSVVDTVDSLMENLFSWHLPWSLCVVGKDKRD